MIDQSDSNVVIKAVGLVCPPDNYVTVNTAFNVIRMLTNHYVKFLMIKALHSCVFTAEYGEN